MFCIPFLNPYNVGMSLNSPDESPKGDWQHAGENLRRRKSSGVYYAFIRRGGKQFRRSLKTTDKAFAKRGLADLLRDIDRLASADAANVAFADAASRWIETTRHALKESTVKRRETYLKAIEPFFLGLQIRNIRPSHCEAWLAERKTKASATLAKELDTMRGAFQYAIEQGWILYDPSKSIKRPHVRNKSPNVMTREQFQSVVTAIRNEPQSKGNAGADLVELIAYSGMRLNEALSLRWRDVNFSRGVFTVTGGERGTKNYEQRTVPLFAEMRALLERIKRGRGGVMQNDFIVRTATARQCLETACGKLELPNFHHHSLRHYFASCAVESGADIPTIAGWLGHKDGGALLMKRYSHLRQSHSIEQAKRVSFGMKPTPETPSE
jgi:integrase